MAIDFRLTREQQNLRETARDFSQNVLAPPVPNAADTRDPNVAFAKTKPAYAEAQRCAAATSNGSGRWARGGLAAKPKH